MRYDSDLLYRPARASGSSYLLQCTIGCSHNQCTFCAMYKEKKFRRPPAEEILEDIDMARSLLRAQCGAGLPHGRGCHCDEDGAAAPASSAKLYAAFPKLRRR